MVVMRKSIKSINSKIQFFFSKFKFKLGGVYRERGMTTVSQLP